MQTIKLSDIKRDDRMRRDYRNIEELAESLWTKGFIHPIAITPDGQLIAGGRRSAALDFIAANPAQFSRDDGDVTMLTLREMDFTLLFGIHFTIKAPDSFADLSELEIIENVQREAMSWQEVCLGIAKIHELKRREARLAGDNIWGQRETGRLFNVSAGNINYSLMLADKLSDEKSPLWACESATEAMKLLVQLEHDRASAALASNIRDRANTLPTATYVPPPTSDVAFIQSFDAAAFSAGGDIANPSDEYGTVAVGGGNETSGQAPSGESGSKSEHDKFEEAVGIARRMISHAKAEDWMLSLPAGCVDHINTDPPYAIEMDNLGQANVDRIAETHDVESNLGDIPKWLAGCWHILRDKGYCIWWCDAMHFRFIHDEAIKVGFKVQRWPLVWIKTTSCMNQRAEFNTTKNYEIAIVMRKPGAKLVSAQSVSTFVGGLDAADKEACPGHPFIKPRELWQWTNRMIALPGSIIADPFSGVGSMTRASILDGYTPMTCEMDEKHYNQQLINAANAYLQLTR